MIAVIFEAEPREGQDERYLAIAASMRKAVGEVEGFVSVERYRSLSDPGRILSLSFFEDEEAVARWRTLASHRAAQRQGRETVFGDYRLRIAEVLRDYGMDDRAQAPRDSRAAHARPAGNERP